ncbi:hypothetical protein A2303_03470 [Candidatus Falkowbacteria bacterium RIFOXYB2_FULL_47_14]|uniref:Uncharacterized protein n=1 Tax=Candidatus Falkowbacteria bacterium RIFOXYA2_FULL_47_19 TaxID=1797994 RepID=A0A1F5SHX0_9BACT|nr:MAG: hypothetical protein A2227_03020 [Candidatus Falkowbacteria bacterium RIFOXYA2_FULL_47_19]OGF36713.1 MAG: hypothetical protein A2468_02755 [Candidatus Falkowbacteria bacterium RIFOXYC2_FULL_46_15]OGF42460.1 MAG: hypothetical protein A2303_03470 [Candidatus Falkowbacteria bacterium RIFOXYB2_FULL_47_14]
MNMISRIFLKRKNEPNTPNNVPDIPEKEKPPCGTLCAGCFMKSPESECYITSKIFDWWTYDNSARKDGFKFRIDVQGYFISESGEKNFDALMTQRFYVNAFNNEEINSIKIEGKHIFCYRNLFSDCHYRSDGKRVIPVGEFEKDYLENGEHGKVKLFVEYSVYDLRKTAPATEADN